MQGMTEGVETFFKICYSCNNYYRCQECNYGLHNYNDVFLLGLDVCLFLRESIRNHVAVGTICTILECILKVKIDFPSVLHAYSHFEALSDRPYAFNCVQCGYYPPILIADVNRKVAFKCRTTNQDLPDEFNKDSDVVDCPEFWRKV